MIEVFVEDFSGKLIPAKVSGSVVGCIVGPVSRRLGVVVHYTIDQEKEALLLLNQIRRGGYSRSMAKPVEEAK